MNHPPTEKTMRGLTTGVVSLRFGMLEYKLRQAVRVNPQLPGVIRIGRTMAFDESKIEDLRAALVEMGYVKPARAAELVA